MRELERSCLCTFRLDQARPLTGEYEKKHRNVRPQQPSTHFWAMVFLPSGRLAQGGQESSIIIQRHCQEPNADRKER